MANKMIPSTKPGYTWALNVSKVAAGKGKAIVAAQEGVVGDGGRSFEYMIGVDRRLQEQVEVDRLTAKRKKEYMAGMEELLRHRGLIA